jgi:hypothetical protein
MTRRLAFLACAIVAASAIAACAPLSRAGTGDGTGDGKAATPGTGITFFGDARLGVAYGPDGSGKSRTRLVAE